MNFSNYRLSLDIHETESGLSLRAKKGDTIRRIYVTLMDGGVPYRITADCTAAFTARKPDNTILFNDALIENNAIVYELTPQTTSMAGQVRCEVRLYGGDGRLITSPRFFLDVDDTVFTEGDEVVSEDEYTILEDAIEAVNQAVADAKAAVEKIAADFQQKVDSGEFTDTVSGAFLLKTGGTMTGNIAMSGNRVTDLGTPAAVGDAVPKSYADAIGTTADSAKQTAENALPKAGGTMTGSIAMSGNKVTGLGTPTAAADAVTKSYADAIGNTAQAAKTTAENALPKSGGTMTGSLTVPVFTVAPGHAWPLIQLSQNADDNTSLRLCFNAQTYQAYFENKADGTTGKEYFSLPALTEGRTDEGWFNILTTKTVCLSGADFVAGSTTDYINQVKNYALTYAQAGFAVFIAGYHGQSYGTAWTFKDTQGNILLGLYNGVPGYHLYWWCASDSTWATAV